MHFFPVLGHFVTTEAENSLPATFQGQSKLGFSIAQIMGFMGNSGGTKSSQSEDNEEKTKEEFQKKPQNHFEMAPNGTNTVAVDQQPLPLMPKLWRPQPFRDYGISHSSQQKYILNTGFEKVVTKIYFFKHFNLTICFQNWSLKQTLVTCQI